MATEAAEEGEGGNSGNASMRSADGEQEGVGAGEEDVEPHVMGEAELMVRILHTPVWCLSWLASGRPRLPLSPTVVG